MKIAFTIKGNDLDADVDPRFGHAANFLIIDTEAGSYETISNEQNLNLGSGAGIQSAEIIVRHKAEVVLTGHCGPNAFRTLTVAGVKLVIGVEGDVKQALDKFKNGEYQSAQTADVEGHW